MRVTIDTERLEFVAATGEQLRAELEENSRLGAMLEAQMPPDWPPLDGEYDQDAIRFFLSRYEVEGDAAEGWYVWYVLLRGAPKVLVAAAGYFGPPDAKGSIEIGYSVSKAYRGQGIATELVGGLVSHATRDPRVRRVYARTGPDNLASIKTLARNGFQAASSEDPAMLRFVRDVSLP